MKIHPTAIVEDGAQLGADVEVGPCAYIGRDVKIGDGTVVKQGAIVDGHTTIGPLHFQVVSILRQFRREAYL